MARCGCTGGCSCRVEDGSFTTVHGTGTPDDPYTIDADFLFTTENSPTVTFSLTGSGSAADPYVLSATSSSSGGGPADAVRYGVQALTVAQAKQARINITTGKMVTPAQYGAVGNGTTNDTSSFQDAVDALNADGGGTLWLTAKSYAVGGLILKSNVVLRSSVKSTLVPPAGYTGWIIDTPATPKQSNMGLMDLTIAGGIVSGASPDTGGVRFRLTAGCFVERCSIAGTSLGAFKQVSGQATRLFGCFFGNYYNFRTLTAVEGALDLGGTDHVVFGCECNAENQLTITDAVNLYRCAMVIRGGTTWVIASNGEYGDVGVRVLGATNRFLGVRGDVNAGHGIMVDGTANNFTNTMVGSNSIGSPGDYDGIYISSTAYGTVLDGVMEFPDFTGGTQHRYVVNDQVDIFGDPKLAPSLPIIHDVVDYQAYKFRRINQKSPYRAIEQPAVGNPAGARPQSRLAAGSTFYDTVNNKATFSDGAHWRDAGGDVVGNLLDPRNALFNDPAEIGWTVLSGSGSTTSVAGGSGWPKFARARMLEVTAGGAATSCGAQMKTSFRATGVVAGTSYSVMLYHLGVTQLANLAVTIIWYDGSGVAIGAAVTLASDAQAVVNTAQLYRKTAVVAPAGAVQANIIPVFTRAGMAAGEKYQIAKVCLVPGAPSDYVEP